MRHDVFASCLSKVDSIIPQTLSGTIRKVVGVVMECEELACPVGSVCLVEPKGGAGPIVAEVVGFQNRNAILMPYGVTTGIAAGDWVRFHRQSQQVRVGHELLGRTIDAFGRPIDGKGPILANRYNPVYRSSPHPLRRQRIEEPLATGVRAIDGLVTCGKGQRMGIFSGTGVGKSVLLGMIGRGTSADATVIALVGERGREVRDFLERDLGPQGLAQSVVVVATSDEPALMRVRAPFVATAVAEHFRDEGLDVLLMMDSVTRMAMAQREIGLATGEPPATKGYPPSVFGMLQRLLERSGRGETGSITGLYAVLVEADDITEPISDAVRGVLDGHVWLSRRNASRGLYPAVSLMDSVSRLMVEVVDREHLDAARALARLLSVHQEAEDIINIGAYNKGSNAEIDCAIRMKPKIEEFIRQDIFEVADYDTTHSALLELSRQVHSVPEAEE